MVTGPVEVCGVGLVVTGPTVGLRSVEVQDVSSKPTRRRKGHKPRSLCEALRGIDSLDEIERTSHAWELAINSLNEVKPDPSSSFLKRPEPVKRLRQML